MPICYEFAPELVIVAAGFDSGAGDPLGGCEVGALRPWFGAVLVLDAACGGGGGIVAHPLPPLPFPPLPTVSHRLR